MQDLIIFPLFIGLFFITNILFKKNNFLIDKYESSNHKKYMNIEKVPINGGILCFLFVIFFFNNLNYYDYLFLFLIMFIGILSDLDILRSPSKRLIIQILIITTYVIIKDETINSTRIFYADYLLSNTIFFKYFFTSLCLIILINGVNFIDGTNMLAGGFIFVTLFCLVLFIGPDQVNSFNSHILGLIYFLLAFLSFNLFSKSFLGDSGSYLLAAILGFICINYSNYFQFVVSPYFIAVLLWYPALENLFSILRRGIFEKRSPNQADNLHLHHLVSNYLSKHFKSKKINNSLTGITINSVLLIFGLIAINYANQTKQLIFLILVKTLIYILSYFYLKKYIKQK